MKDPFLYGFEEAIITCNYLRFGEWRLIFGERMLKFWPVQFEFWRVRTYPHRHEPGSGAASVHWSGPFHAPGPVAPPFGE